MELIGFCSCLLKNSGRVDEFSDTLSHLSPRFPLLVLHTMRTLTKCTDSEATARIQVHFTRSKHSINILRVVEEIFVTQCDNHSSTQRNQNVSKSAGSDLPQLDNHRRTESRLCLSTIERKLLTEREREKRLNLCTTTWEPLTDREKIKPKYR